MSASFLPGHHLTATLKYVHIPINIAERAPPHPRSLLRLRLRGCLANRIRVLLEKFIRTCLQTSVSRKGALLLTSAAYTVGFNLEG
jgi:hypothetical protein